MQNRILLVVFLACLAIGAGAAGWRLSRQPHREVVSRSRVPELKAALETQEKESAEAAASYQPKSKQDLNDLASSPVEFLRQLPGVADVEVAVAADKPSHRIIHIRDWHFVSKDLYRADLTTSMGPRSDEEIDRRHEELCLEVAIVQEEQMALLQCLAKHHGLRRVLCEGLTNATLPKYREHIAALRSIEREDVPRLQGLIEEARAMQSRAREGDTRHQKAKDLDEECRAELWKLRRQTVEVGAVGRLRMLDNLKEVLPLDDEGLLDAAKPVAGGKVHFEPDKVAARRDAIVRNAMASGPVSVIVLGANHDLSDSATRLGETRCEYLRLTTKAVKHLLGD